MERNAIILPRLYYILISALVIAIFITRAENMRNAVLPAALHVPELVTEHMEEVDEAYVHNYGNLKDIYDKIVYIDPGHGGIDDGASVGGHNEKDINLNIALMVYNMLRESGSGIHPVLSRQGDVFIGRYDRAAQGSAAADIIVSIHCNTFEQRSVHGTETYYDKNQILGPSVRTGFTSMELAEIIQRNIIEATGSRDRGARDINQFRMELAMTTAARVPSVVVEAGYMTNPAELALLVTEEYQHKLAVGIFNGILEAFGAKSDPL